MLYCEYGSLGEGYVAAGLTRNMHSGRSHTTGTIHTCVVSLAHATGKWYRSAATVFPEFGTDLERQWRLSLRFLGPFRLRRTISDSTTASGVADEQDMVYINKALEEKYRNVRIQIWYARTYWRPAKEDRGVAKRMNGQAKLRFNCIRGFFLSHEGCLLRREKKRQRMQSEAQLNKMTAMLGESSEVSCKWQGFAMVDHIPKQHLLIRSRSSGKSYPRCGTTLRRWRK
jgi:hypothetical protein